ncbi:MAG: Ig-like domain-containing protein [Bacteroidota bacterium]
MKNLLTLLFLCIAFSAKSQTAAQYVFSRATGSPATISGGAGTVSTTDISADDATLQDIPIGFSFTFCGVTYTTLSACSNGWLSLSNSSSDEWINSAANVPGAGHLMPCWDDLSGGVGAGTAFYQTSGTAPNRVFTFQWGNAPPNGERWGVNTGLSSGRAVFQAKLYESSNVIQFCYLNNSYSLGGATIGIANSSSDRLTLPTVASTTAGTAFTTSLGSIPVVNTILTWTPPPVMNVSPSSLSFTTGPSTNTAGQNIALTAYGLTSTVTATASTNYQVYNGSTWGSSASISNSSAAVGTYINTNVPVRFVGPSSTGTYTGTVTFTSTGATTRTVNLTGNVVPVCTGTPTAGTVSATATTGSCNPYTPTLSTTGTSATYNITYQWQWSSDDASYTNVTGATNPTYTPTISAAIYYRARIGCSSSGGFANTLGVLFSYTAPPAAITGSSSVCAGSTLTLSSATSGGAWTSSSTAVATVTGGVVTGVAAGTATITYTASGCPVTKAITVNGQPSAIALSPASATVCIGGSASFTAAATGPSATLLNQDFNAGLGAWTITNGTGNAAAWWQIRTPPGYSDYVDGDGTPYIEAASDASASAVTTTMFISPSFSTVGYTSATLTYNQHFESLSGSDNQVRVQYSINGGSSWTVLYDQIDVDDITYSFSAGTPQVSVALPGAAVGQPSVMIRWRYVSDWGFWWIVDNIKVTGVSTVTYAWTGNAGATGLSCTSCTNPTITPGATGANSYSVTATATSNGCTRSAGVTVTANPLPAAIGGTVAVCQGLTTTLTNTTGGGTWSSGNTAVATIGASTGIVTGVAAGTANVTYTVTATGCSISAVVTVNALPATITGTGTACVGSTTTLASATTGGTWSSGIPGIATIGASNGVVNGIAAGLAPITYTLSTGCIATTTATINPLPETNITPSTSATICAGESAAFTAFAPQPAFSLLFQDFNSGLGAWTVTSPSGDPASAWRITTTPSSSATGDGTAMLESDAQFMTPTATYLTSPSFATTGYGAAQVTFNQYLISLASSDAFVDVEYSTDGGTVWTMLNSQVDVQPPAPAAGSGSWSAATPQVTINMPGGALGQPNVKLRWRYESNFGLYWDIDNIKVNAFQAANTYVWTGIAGASGLSCTSCGSVTLTPTATGANVYSVTTTTANGCTATSGVTVSVNPLPAAITGTLTLCANTATTLSSTDAGGTWSTADATVSVGASSGIITGVSAGTAIVTYTLSTGCRTMAVVTVNEVPAATTGTLTVCQGLTTTLVNATVGGTWSSANAGIATVDAVGVVTGVAPGFVDIDFTITATGCKSSAAVTVNALPAAIGGTLQACEGLTTTLTNADAGGTWTSGTTAVATIGSGTGMASGVAFGTSVVTYMLPTGCINTAILTVNALPANIAGTMQVCTGLTTTLTNTTAGGAWSTASANASIDGGGIVTGISGGTATITYTTVAGCIKTAEVTVNALPAVISGTLQVCEGLTTSLSNADAGGGWTSGTTSVATIDAAGVATGIIAGTTIITYMLPTGCINTDVVTVNPLPAPITGTMQVCEGLTTTLSDASTGGTWASSAAIAPIDMTSGVVTGLFAGVTTITYTLPTGCITVADVTVNALPAAITGATQVCEGLTATVATASTGGAWSVSNAAIATISTAGVVTGVADGTVTLTYTLPTGCITTSGFTVHPTPDAITGTLEVCVGLATSLTSASGGGTWQSGATGTATVDLNSGVVTGISAGTAAITYTLPTTCITVSNATVHPLPAAITGTADVCVGSTTTLANATTGGTWSASNAAVGTISAAGIVTGISAGTMPATYMLPTGCISTRDVVVNPLPAAIGGSLQVCTGSSTILTNADAGGTWLSANPAIASVGVASGLVSGNTMGSTTITYTLPTGCKTNSAIVVNPLPAPITGATQLCEGSTGTLGNGSPGGVWTSTTPAVATIDGTTGAVAAIASGTTIITYTLSTGCIRTRTLTVNIQPAPVTGTAVVCQGSTTSLADATAGGTWISGTPGIATVNAAGIVSGVSAGTAAISYRLPTGCTSVANVSVNAIPAAITGGTNICTGLTTTLASATAGGIWTSGMPTVATVDASGVVTGVTAGLAVISYSYATGCGVSTAVVVATSPAAIVGASQICQGATTVMTNATFSGSWSSSAPAIAGAGLHTGIISGYLPGAATITYTLPSGCYAVATIAVDPLPAAITGTLAVCNGQTSVLSTTSTGGTWTSSNPAIATISTTGTVTSVAPGTATISYMLAAGCARSVVATVNALPTVYNVTGGGNYCIGSAGVHIGTSGSNSGISYQLYNSGVPSGLPLGGVTGSPVNFGFVTEAGAYTVTARNAATGCTVNMTGVANVTASPVVIPVVTVTVPGGFNVCAGSAVTFTGTPVNGGATPAYQWKVNGAIIPGATAATYAYTPAEGDIISVNMTSSQVCAIPAAVADAHTITVSPVATPTATIAAIPSTNICEGDMATFNVAATYGGSAPAYVWYKNGTVAGSGSSFAYMPANGDNVYVKMASNYACRLADTVAGAALSMVVSPVYIPSVTITADPGIAVKAGEIVRFTATATGAGPSPSYQWYVGTVQIPAATNPTYTSSGFVTGDSITCQVIGTGACGLKAFNSVVMTVLPAGVTTVTAIGDVILVPNPNKGQFSVRGTLTVKADQEVAIEITNMLGQTVYSSKVMARNGVINQQLQLDNTLANGMYMLNMVAGEDRKVFHFVLEQ